MLDATFVNAIADRAVAAAGINFKPYRPEAEPAHVYFLGSERHEAVPAPRGHKAADLSAIVAFAKYYEKTSAVWYDRNGVACLIDDQLRRDQVGIKLHPSPQLAMIKSWGDCSKPYKQSSLVLMLRTLFKNNLRQCPKLIYILRVLRFQVGSDVDAKVAHGKSSVGKQITSVVTGADVLPEGFVVEIPVWDNANLDRQFAVEIALDMDAASESFSLLPIPGAIESAQAEGEAWLAGLLTEGLGKEYQRLYYGCP